MVGRSNIYLWNRDCLVVTAGNLITWKISKTKKDMGKSNQNEFVVSKQCVHDAFGNWCIIHPCSTPVLPIETRWNSPHPGWYPGGRCHPTFVGGRRLRFGSGLRTSKAARSCCLTTGQRSQHLEVPEFRLMDFLKASFYRSRFNSWFLIGIWNLTSH